MLPKQYRLTKDQELKRVFSSKKGIFDHMCGIKFRPNETDVSRFAFVVGTKVSKKAVDRNRIRRQYREIVRPMLQSIKPGYDAIFLVGPAALGATFEEKEKRLKHVLKKAALL